MPPESAQAEAPPSTPNSPEPKNAPAKPAEKSAPGEVQETGGANPLPGDSQAPSDDAAESGKDSGEKAEGADDPAVEVEVKGETYKVPLSELKRGWQQVVAAREALQEAQGLAESATDLFIAIEKSPQEALVDWLEHRQGKGRDAAYRTVLESAMTLVKEYFDFQDLPPAERKAKLLERELDDEKKRTAKLQSEREAEEQEAEEFEAARSLAKELKPALAKAGLPNEAGVIRMVAEVLAATREEGFPVTADHACRLIKAELEQKDEEGLKRRSVDDILRLRPDLEEAVSQRRVNQVVEKKNAQRVPKANGTVPPAKPTNAEPRVFKDVLELLER